MVWIDFSIYAGITIVLWILGLAAQVKRGKSWLGVVLLGLGILVLTVFIARLWILLERPPMRTLGETRLWYGFFLPIVGLITYWRWRYNWFLVYTFGLASLFLILNMAYPENYNKTLMPALQSIWFVPHVLVYIVSYALLAASSVVSAKGIFDFYIKKKPMIHIDLADNLVYLGFAFLTMGLLFGALWAKEAWGHYWTWDPKETWALLTWMVYLVYIHLRIHKTVSNQKAVWVLALAFVVLLICWFGVNYLPSASNSVHTYSQS